MAGAAPENVKIYLGTLPVLCQVCRGLSTNDAKLISVGSFVFAVGRFEDKFEVVRVCFRDKGENNDCLFSITQLDFF